MITPTALGLLQKRWKLNGILLLNVSQHIEMKYSVYSRDWRNNIQFTLHIHRAGPGAAAEVGTEAGASESDKRKC